MSAQAQAPNVDGGPFQYGGCGHAFGRGFGPPLPLKILAVVGAFWLAPPLGLAALGYFVWRNLQGRRAWGEGRGADWRSHSWRARPSGNSAFDEKRRETLRALEDEAKAFAEFERQQREQQDREAFDRFVAERNNPPKKED
jgi:hypothetical protein